MSDPINTRGTTPRAPTARPAAAPGGAPAAAGGPRGAGGIAAAGLRVLGGLVGYYGLSAQPIWVRIALVVVGVAAAIGAFAVSSYGRQVWQFALGSRVELRKMVWPNLAETRTITLIVFAFVLMLGAFFWIVDWALAWGTRHLLGTGA